jgi:hypothetical protein
MTQCLPFQKAIDLYEFAIGSAPSLQMSERVTQEVGESMYEIEKSETNLTMLKESRYEETAEHKPDVLYVQMDMTAYQERDGWKMATLGVIYDNAHNKEYIGRQTGELDEFGDTLYATSLRHGLNYANHVVALGDGARCNWNQFELHFPNAIQILDWSHAVSYLKIAGDNLYGKGTKRSQKFYKEFETLLWNGGVIEVIKKLQKRLNAMKSRLHSDAVEEITKVIHYYSTNMNRMRYHEYRWKGFDIGSGAVESACRQVVGDRIKDCSMRWTKENSKSVLIIRTAYLSGKINTYWNKILEKSA